MSDYMEPIYLNNAATSWPKPPGVAEAMAETVRKLPGAAHRGGIQDFDVFDAVRDELAKIMGVSVPQQIALGSNSTWGLNCAIFGYPLERGDAVLTTVAEHNAVLRPLHRLEQKGVRVVYLKTDACGRVSAKDWERALAQVRPKLCVLNHASNVTGAVNDAEKLTALAKQYRAALLLDVSQTLGWIPVELEKWGVDMAAFTGHKYLLGPQGTGGLYVRTGLELTPYLLGGTGVLSDLKDMPEEMPLHLEAGTGNEPSYCGLLAALQFAGQNPPDTERTYALLARLREGLAELGCRVIAPDAPVTPVLSFAVPGISPVETGEILTENYDIICRAGLHCAPDILESIGMPQGTVRLSLSRFTTQKEIEQALQAVKDIVESGYGISV